MAPRSSGRQGGFTYLGLIILVTVIGMVGAATIKIGALMQRAQAEEELLDAGAAFSAALQSYAAATPAGQLPQPPSLRELLKDPRTPALRRHLRKIFVDPVTGSTDWGIVYLADRLGVVAVFSRSQAKPLKIGNFDARFAGFDNKQHLSDWKFTAGGMVPVVPAPVAPLIASSPVQPPQAPAVVQTPAPAEPEQKVEEQPEPQPEPQPAPQPTDR